MPQPQPEYVVPREVVTRIVLADPTDDWARQYAVEDALVREALGDALCELHHAGSTSVPGLAAKPVIDIVLAVPDATDEGAYVPALEGAGYVLHHREPHWHEHRLLKKGLPHFAPERATDVPAVNLHVFPDGCEEVRRMVAFRDHLRTHADDRRLYEDTKRALATRSWERVQDYADAKSDVVAEIMGRSSQPSKGDGSPAPIRSTSG